MLGTFAVADEVASFLQNPEQVLGVKATDRAMVPPLLFKSDTGVYFFADDAQSGATKVKCEVVPRPLGRVRCIQVQVQVEHGSRWSTGPGSWTCSR